LFDSFTEPLTVANKLPFNPLKDPALLQKLAQGDEGLQFSHTFEEQIGGQLGAGFVITGAYEDYDNPAAPDAIKGIPTYWATKAVKLALDN
jgi:hypothetical protein